MMCKLTMIKNAQSVVNALSEKTDFLERLKKEYNASDNYVMALKLTSFLLDEARKELLNPEFLYSELEKGICLMTYIKADGKPREAVATLSVEHGAPEFNNGAKRKTKAENLLYYDVEKGALRQCRIETITEFKRTTRKA